MNNIFRFKRKLHKLVNMFFYLLFFIVGFLLGGGSLEKIIDYIGNAIKFIFSY